MSSSDRATKNSISIREEAARWVVRLDGGRLSQQNEQAFREWVARSPRHRAEVQRLASLWDGLDDLLEPEIEAAVSSVVSRQEGRFRRSIKYVGAIAATVLVALIFLPQYDREPVVQPISYASAIGEQRTVKLLDGSTVVLNSGSEIQERFRNSERVITLVRGEAVFDVAHDKARPFFVYAGTNAVRAVGTAFSVLYGERQVEVIVTEGTVELSAHASDLPVESSRHLRPLAQVSAGQYAKFNSTIDSITPISKEETEQKLAWQFGMLVFDGNTLQEVVSDIGRYSHLDIVITDATVRGIKISGRFRTGDTEGLLSALEDSFDIRVERRDSGKVYLSKKS